MEDEAFMKQFTGSASANMVFVIAFMVYTGLKKLCSRDSKCKTKVHTCCIDVDIRDDDVPETIRVPPIELQSPRTKLTEV